MLLNFAESDNKKNPPLDEIGVAGDSIVGGFGDDEARVDKYTAQDYRRMRQTDGNVDGLYNIITLSILSAGRRIKADEEDTGEEQAKLVRHNLMDPPHKGGMELPLSLILADMLRAVLEGFRSYEKVWKIDAGKIVLKKLAIRDGDSLKLRRADDGGFNGLHQTTTFKGKSIDVIIPAEKSFLFTYGKDKNYLYGESGFKSAAFHYEKKHKFYYLSEIQAQARAIPPAIAQANEMAAEDPKGEIKKKVLQALAMLGFKRSVAYLPKGIDAKPYDLGTGSMDMLPYIDHHDTQMARAFLAQMIMLGTTSSSKGGSYALSSDHSDLFMVALQGIMKNIEEHINFFVIPELIDYNFAERHYPAFEFEEISGAKFEILKNAFDKILGSANPNEALVKGVVDQMAENLEIDLEEIQKQLDKEHAEEAKKNQELAAKGLLPNGQPIPPVDPNVKPDPNKKPVPPDTVVNQSDEGAGEDPKGSGGPSPRQKRQQTLAPYRSDLML